MSRTTLLKSILLVFGIFLVFQLEAQKILILDKPGKVKRLRFYEGDYISLKLESRQRMMGEITQLRDSSFYLGGKEVKLSEVFSVRNPKGKSGLRILAKLALPASLMYLGIDSFNRTINEENPIVREKSLVLSSTFFGVFLISNSIANRQLKINKKRSLRIIDISI